MRLFLFSFLIFSFHTILAGFVSGSGKGLKQFQVLTPFSDFPNYQIPLLTPFESQLHDVLGTKDCSNAVPGTMEQASRIQQSTDILSSTCNLFLRKTTRMSVYRLQLIF
jgi:hypothetical protein